MYERNPAMRAALVTGLLAAATVLAACGNPMVQPAPRQPVPKAPEVRADPDAFRDFRGEHVQPGVKFRLAGKPVAVDGVHVVLTLDRTEWSTMQSPSGKEIREATAHLKVQKGQEERPTFVTQGQTRTAFDARIEVLDAGEEYDQERMRHLPWVDLVVQPAQ